MKEKNAKKTKTKKLVLFDAHAILHRAYHALPDFATQAGEPTGGLYGLATMLMRIITDLKPDYLAACYDLAEPTFRKKIYADYKGKRPKVDEALIPQFERSRDIFTAFHIPIYAEPGFEADDIIGTIVEQTKKEQNLQIIIASGDMDTMQLVAGERVVVYTLKKGITDTVTYDETAVRERYGFPPARVADYKGLRGDPSDNIIGIPGIGEKTATDLITNFGAIEDIYKKLKKGETAFLGAGIKQRIVDRLKEHEEEALFSKTLATIRRDAPIKFTLPQEDWKTSFDPNQVEKIFADLEFRSLRNRVKSLMAATGVMATLFGEDEEEKKSEKLPTDWPTVALALWLINSELADPQLADLQRITKRADYSEAKKILLAEIKKRGLEKVYQDIELPLTPILKKIQEHGVLIDTDYLKKLATDYHRELDELTKKIFKLAGREFNVNSPKQLGAVLFDELGLSTGKAARKTPGGARTTRESELQKLVGTHPIIENILAYRELEKLLSTYIDVIPKLVDENNRLHTTYNQTGTVTGRLSSSDPNLQNIPVKSEKGEAIRRAFIAPAGRELLAFDYSQIEIRVLAELSGDAELKKIFKTGADVHTAVAARVFGVSAEGVTKEMRRRAKVINFGIIYGMGVTALQTVLGSSRIEAKEFYDNYFAAFPTIRNYLDGVKREAAEKGYTVTAFGRRRYFPLIKSRLPFLRTTAERMAMNAPLQGTAADLMKRAMIATTKELAEKKLNQDAVLVLQIHDELIYEVTKSKITEVAKIIKSAMENVVAWSIPLLVSVETGPNWGELK